MKCSVIIIFTILCKILNAKTLIEIENNVIFIEDIKNWLKITHVILLYDSDDDSEEDIFIFSICRLLIMKRIQTATSKLTNLQNFNKLYEKCDNQPLIAVYLSKTRSLKNFENFTGKVNMKWATWLIIFTEKFEASINYCPNPPRNIFNLSFNSKVIVKCHEDKNLYKWNSIHGNETKIRNLATWDEESHIFNKTRDIFLGIEHNLGGKTLKSITCNNPVARCKYLEFNIGVLKELGRVMNFTYVFIKQESQYITLGYEVWVRIINKTISGEVDIAAAEVVLDAERTSVLDFPLHLIEYHVALYFRHPNSTEIQRVKYFHTFNKYAWAVFILLLITVLLCLIYIMRREENFKSLPLMIQENFFDVWGIFCQQAVSEFPKRGSLRIIYFVTFMLSLVLFVVYSSTLISRFAVVFKKLPFNSLDQFLRQNKYKLIVCYKELSVDYIKNSQDKYAMKMKKLLKADKELPLNAAEGFNMICQDKHLVFMIGEGAEGININCNFKKIRTSSKLLQGMALPKNSPYTAMVNYQLLRFKEYGILKRLMSQTVENKLQTQVSTAKLDFEYQNAQAITLCGVDIVFEIVAYAFILSTVILILEKIYFYYSEERKRKKRNDIIAIFSSREIVKNSSLKEKNCISILGKRNGNINIPIDS